MAERRKKGLSRSNRNGIIAVAGIVTVLILYFLIRSQQLMSENSYYESRKAELSQQIQDEEVRSEEIDNLKEYVNSTEFIEKMAREKLGLVYDDEIVFKAED